MGSNDARIAAARARLQSTRAQIFSIAQAVADGRFPPSSELVVPAYRFPRSRLMRLLFDHRRGLLIGSAALGVSLWRPRLLWQAVRLTPRLAPMLRPLVTRFLVPRLLGHR